MCSGSSLAPNMVRLANIWILAHYTESLVCDLTHNGWIGTYDTELDRERSVGPKYQLSDAQVCFRRESPSDLSPELEFQDFPHLWTCRQDHDLCERRIG